ncbi:MAG: exo-alpha-sialidase [Bacteroidetes bacterium]|nr:exo-alpha-sialidase [Bacteroidota bacterium]
MRAVLFCFFAAIILNCFSQIKSIQIASFSFKNQAIEVAINPKNSNKIILATATGEAYYSFNGGLNWKTANITSLKKRNLGHSLLFWDALENAYFIPANDYIPTTQRNNSNILLYKSSNYGALYDSSFTLFECNKNVPHNFLVSVNEKTNTFYFCNAEYYTSTDSKDSLTISYSQSNYLKHYPLKKNSFTLKGATDKISTHSTADFCIGLDSDIYFIWKTSTDLMLTKSTHDGKYFLQQKSIAPIKSSTNKKQNSHFECAGKPYIACDLSNSPYKGRVYVCWCDEKNGKDNKDVFLAYSDDKGETFSDPILVTYFPNHKNQFMPFMTINQSNGDIYIMYYGEQNYIDGKQTDVFIAKSTDGGMMFNTIKLNEKSCVLDSNKCNNKNFSVSAVKQNILPAWLQAGKNNTQAILAAPINDSIFNIALIKSSIKEIKLTTKLMYSDKISVKLLSTIKTKLSLAIYDPLKPASEKIIIKNKSIKKGENNFVIKTANFDIKPGTYVLYLYYNNKSYFEWIYKE